MSDILIAKRFVKRHKRASVRGSAQIQPVSDYDFMPRNRDTSSVLDFPFGEGSGTRVIDLSHVGGNNGTIHGATWATAGRVGNTLSFDGVDDWVNVPDSASLGFVGNGSLGVWIFSHTLPAAGVERGIASKGSDIPSGGWGMFLLQLGANFRFAVVIAGVGYNVTSPVTATINTWYHIVGVREGATIRIFVDGVVTTATAATGSLRHANASFIGTNPNRTAWFHGLIDEARLYNRALSADEIRAYWNATR